MIFHSLFIFPIPRHWPDKKKAFLTSCTGQFTLPQPCRNRNGRRQAELRAATSSTASPSSPTTPMGSCLASIFKGGGPGGRGKYGPLRTSTTARYGTNSRNQSYLGPGHSGKGPKPMGGFGGSGHNSTTSGGGLTCPACGYTTQYKREMHQHIAARHGGKIKRPRPSKTAAAPEYVPGGEAGERRAEIKWADLHKSEGELRAEHEARQRPPDYPRDEHRNKKGSRLSRASKSVRGFAQSARSMVASHGLSSGTHGTSSSTRIKKKKKKKGKKKEHN